MFGWSKPTCPCDPASKDWIERRFGWLSRQFPFNIFTGRSLVLPTEEFFPEGYEESKAGAAALLLRVCHFMGVSEDRVRLKFVHEPNKVWFVNNDGQYLPLAAGIYERSGRRHLITLDTDQLCEPAHLITTMAHELAHARLLGEGRVRRRGYDEELLTDLTAFFLGFAIFLANSLRVWPGQFSKWPGTDFNKPEYMSVPMFGYALAHLAWFQGQRKPPWRKFLSSQVMYDFKEGVRFLFDTEESDFRPGHLMISRVDQSSE